MTVKSFNTVNSLVSVRTLAICSTFQVEDSLCYNSTSGSFGGTHMPSCCLLHICAHEVDVKGWLMAILSAATLDAFSSAID